MNRCSRAQVLLGTLVTIDIAEPASRAMACQAMDAAFEVIAHIGRVMSAHDPDSDLGRLSRAQSGTTLRLDRHTVTVLEAALHWQRIRGGAFHPVRAAQHLMRAHRRPGLHETADAHLNLQDLVFLSETEVRVPAPLAVDLGGIAKGYAVDQALLALRLHGIEQACVNAGGDVGMQGTRRVQMSVRHAQREARDRRLWRKGFTHGALATSTAAAPFSEWVCTAGRAKPLWKSATVWAPECMVADALTKWALQSSLLCPQLTAALRQHRARMWRSA
mgnify:FL=1